MKTISAKREGEFRKKVIAMLESVGAVLTHNERDTLRYAVPNRKVLPMEVTLFSHEGSDIFSVYFRSGRLFTQADMPAASEVLKGLPFCSLNPFNLKWNVHEYTAEEALKETKRRLDFLMEGDGELILPMERLLA